MMFVEAIIYILQMAFPFTTSFNIANTAHIIGGATGLVLGRIDLFARR
jgi:membrane associated rhomboid family serine protease